MDYILLSDQNNKKLCEVFGIDYVYMEFEPIIYTGEPVSSWSKGLNLTDEHKKAISESRLGEKNWMFGVKHSDEYKQKMSNAMKGKNKTPKTDEHKLKISQTLKGRKPVWKKVKCPHCDKIAGENVAYRWHFGNCKSGKVV
jgi:hypothetical protein